MTIDFAGIASRADLPSILGAEGIDLRNGLALCPFHDNTRTPALSVYFRDGRWHFKCHSCGVGGDAITWRSLRDGIGVIEAARKLDPSLADTRHRPPPSRPTARPAPASVPAPSRPDPIAAWQDRAWQGEVDALVAYAERGLWGEYGAAALAWLRRRGLDDETIRRYRLGHMRQDVETRRIDCLKDDRGRPRRIIVPRGITMPWLRPGSWFDPTPDPDGADPGPRWVGVNVRRLMPDPSEPLPPGTAKCICFAGSTRGYLYPEPTIDATQGHRPVLIVEGEMDALIGSQLVGHLVHVVTAGSASVRHLPRPTLAALARCPTWLIATDHDEAGVKAALHWRSIAPHKARRVLLPFGKDLCEFVGGGGDLVGWVSTILGTVTARPR